MTIERRGHVSNLRVINNQLVMYDVVVSSLEPEGNIYNDEDEALAHLDHEPDKEALCDNIEGHALGGDLKVAESSHLINTLVHNPSRVYCDVELGWPPS